MRKVPQTEVQFGWQSYNGTPALRNVIFFPGKGHTSQFSAGAHTLLQLLLVSVHIWQPRKGRLKTEVSGQWIRILPTRTSVKIPVQALGNTLTSQTELKLLDVFLLCYFTILCSFFISLSQVSVSVLFLWPLGMWLHFWRRVLKWSVGARVGQSFPSA